MNDARIHRVHNSWRVRVPDHPAKFFAFSAYGGAVKAKQAARQWRDAHWNGQNRNAKLTPAERAAIAASTEHYKEVAARYGVTPHYVHYLRRSRK